MFWYVIQIFHARPTLTETANRANHAHVWLTIFISSARAGSTKSASAMQKIFEPPARCSAIKKLWVALAMPVHGIDIDPATLALLDEDKDGKVHVDDILAAVAWVCATFKDPGDVLDSATEVRFDSIANAEIVATAKRMLVDLGKTGSAISFDDVAAITKAFVDTKLNGDGVVHAESTADVDLTRVITDGVASVGSVADRSGKPGLDQAKADELFAEVDKRHAWLVRGKQVALEALGAGTPAAADALAAVRAKIEDFFTRSKVAASSTLRGAAALSAAARPIYLALSGHLLGSADEELAKFPLSRIDATGRLSLRALNPAWTARMTAFETAAVSPGPRRGARRAARG